MRDYSARFITRHYKIVPTYSGHYMWPHIGRYLVCRGLTFHCFHQSHLAINVLCQEVIDVYKGCTLQLCIDSSPVLVCYTMETHRSTVQNVRKDYVFRLFSTAPRWVSRIGDLRIITSCACFSYTLLFAHEWRCRDIRQHKACSVGMNRIGDGYRRLLGDRIPNTYSRV